MSLPARLCWYLDAHRWSLAAMNIAAAALFVVGCVGFFWPSLYVGSVTLFLLGSLLFLAAALGAALLEPHSAVATATATTACGEPAAMTPTPSTRYPPEQRSSPWDAGTRWP